MSQHTAGTYNQMRLAHVEQGSIVRNIFIFPFFKFVRPAESLLSENLDIREYRKKVFVQPIETAATSMTE